MKINHAIIRIVGLLGEESDKKGSYVHENSRTFLTIPDRS